MSIGEPVTGSVVKFSRKEMSDMMRADRDWSGEARPQEGTCMCISTAHNQDDIHACFAQHKVVFFVCNQTIVI